MKSGIIGLPQVAKTSLFRMLTKTALSAHALANPREAHIGVAKVPDDRLDRLAALYHPKKLTPASIEYFDRGAIGLAELPDTPLDRLAALYHPKKLTHAAIEYVDVGAIGQDALKETAYIGHLREVDALVHVLRAFEDESIPHVGPIDPLRDIKNVEFDLM